MREAPPAPSSSDPKKEEATRRAEKMRELVFWSFQMAQGSIDLHQSALRALLGVHPELGPVVRSYAAAHRKGKDETTRFDKDPSFQRAVADALRFTTARAHVTARGENAETPEELAHEGVRIEYEEFIFQAQRQARLTPNSRQHADSLKQLTDELVGHEFTFLQKQMAAENKKDPKVVQTPQTVGRLKARLKQGGSLLMRFALAEDRAEARVHMPQELQDLWEAVGNEIRAQEKEKTMGSETAHYLNVLRHEHEYRNRKRPE